ncbi:MAG: T9SS type A sorting domain-containing protein [Flavobacteriales bacterium]|nr:T9SS type A sorting domain-containing protein [Flavobacteriales bacterium]
MKKLYIITMMLVTFLTSNLFSQVTLPYTVSNGNDFFNDWDNSVTFDVPAQGTQTFTETFPSSPNNFVSNQGGSGIFLSTSGSYNPPTFEGNSVLEINPSAMNIDYTIDYNWINGANKNVKLWGSVDGINYVVINSNVSDNTPLTFDNTLTNYTFLMIQFNSTNVTTANLRNVSLTPSSSTDIENINLKDNYNVYSYGKNLVIKSNDFNNYAVTVYNLNGQVVLNETTNGNKEFPLNVSNGMYLVNINNGTESYHQKIIIQ